MDLHHFMLIKPKSKQFFINVSSNILSTDERFIYYFKSCVSFHVASIISERAIAGTESNVILELICFLITTTTDNSPRLPWHRRPSSGIAYLKSAEEYMVCLDEFDSQLETCLAIKAIKRFLKKALEIRDKFSESVHSLSRIYLASLYLLTENYDKCFHHLEYLSRENNLEKAFCI